MYEGDIYKYLIREVALKKLIFFVASLALVLPAAAQNEIPNWDMETWTSTITHLPQQWQLRMGIVSRVTGHNGLYACKVVNDPLKGNPGVVLDGYTSDGQNFTGGIPFTQRPDSVRLFCTYHIVAGDTAYVLVLFKKQGVNLAYQWIPIAANNAVATTFTPISRKITYIDTNRTHLPDSVIVGVICTNPNNQGTWPVGDTLVVDDISFPGTTTAIPNGTFEAWDSLTTYTLPGWYGTSGNNDTAYSIARSTDKFAGNYSVLVQNSVTARDTMFGMASTTTLKDSSQNKPSFKVSQRYLNFSFAYKYLPKNGDTMNVMALFYNNHSQIASAQYRSSETDSVWKQVNTPINYYNPNAMITPDSATIFLSATGSNQPRGNSKLYIDNLSFATSQILLKPIKSLAGTGFSVTMSSQSKLVTMQFNVGTSDHVTIKLMDLAGREINELVNRTVLQGTYTMTFDASHLSKGVYLVQKMTGSSIETRKIIVAR